MIPGAGLSSGEGNGDPLQCSCLENPMDRGAWGLQSMELQRVGHDCVTKQQRSPLGLTDLLIVQGTLEESSPTPQFKSISALALSLLYGPNLT